MLECNIINIIANSFLIIVIGSAISFVVIIIANRCQNWFHSVFAGLHSSIMISLSAESLRPYSIRSQLASAGYSGERSCELQPFQSLAAFSHRSLEKRRYDMMR